MSSPLRVSDWYGLEKTDDKFSRVSASTRVSTLLQWVILLGYRNRFVLMYLGQGLHLYGNISFLIALITKPFLVFNSLFGQVEFGIYFRSLVPGWWWLKENSITVLAVILYWMEQGLEVGEGLVRLSWDYMWLRY